MLKTVRRGDKYKHKEVVIAPMCRVVAEREDGKKTISESVTEAVGVRLGK